MLVEKLKEGLTVNKENIYEVLQILESEGVMWDTETKATEFNPYYDSIFVEYTDEVNLFISEDVDDYLYYEVNHEEENPKYNYEDIKREIQIQNDFKKEIQKHEQLNKEKEFYSAKEISSIQDLEGLILDGSPKLEIKENKLIMADNVMVSNLKYIGDLKDIVKFLSRLGFDIKYKKLPTYEELLKTIKPCNSDDENACYLRVFEGEMLYVRKDYMGVIIGATTYKQEDAIKLRDAYNRENK